MPGDSSAEDWDYYGGRDDKTPHLSLVVDTWNMGVCALGQNKPKSGSIPIFSMFVNTGKPRKSRLFGSCGKYAQLSPYLPKYGRNSPHPKATKGIFIDAVFAT